MSLLLIEQIGTMFIMLAIGYIIVKSKLLTVENSKILSTMVLYVIAPCTIISSFQMDYSTDKMMGLLMSTAAALVVHAVFIIVTRLLKKPFRLTNVERASIIYPNALNLIIPIIIAVLGKEWVFYSTGYMIVQTLLMWTHGKSLVKGETAFDWKKIVLNINVIAMIIGLLMFLFRLRLPTAVGSALGSVSSAMGPVTMIGIGMLLGGVGFKRILSDKRAYLVCGLRLIILPVIIVLTAGLSGAQKLHPDGFNILLITVLSASSSAAATMTQFAQIFNKEPEHAGVINVMSVLFCIVTLPLMVWLYQLIS